MSGMTSGQAAFKMAFELSPIVLTGGLAGPIPGGMLPLISLTEALNFTRGLLSGGGVSLDNLDNFFAQFKVMPGGTLVDNAVATYPLANQATAANAIVSQPLKISLRMICPVKAPLGYAAKLATMMALQATLNYHNNSGGTYIVATPSFIYTNCLLANMSDASSGQSRQDQTEWQLDFVKPLLTLSDVEQAQNSLMSKITGGTFFSGAPSWSGLEQTVNAPPTLASSSVVPASIGAISAGTPPPIPGIPSGL